jgi:glycosyltransferase involved in cell wall biosynthesis
LAALTSESLEYSNGGKMAILFEINNYDDFIEKLKNIDEYYAVTKNSIDANKSQIAEMFDRNKNAKLLMKTYKSVLGE